MNKEANRHLIDRKPPKAMAEEIYNKMKGFRVTNMHRRKTARVCVNYLIENAWSTDKTYWLMVMDEVNKILPSKKGK